MTSRVPSSSPRSPRRRRAGAIGLTAAASLIAITALGGAVATSSSALVSDPQGFLLLTTNGSPQLNLDQNGDGIGDDAAAAQALTLKAGTSCELAGSLPSVTGKYVGLSGKDGSSDTAVGIQKGSIGVLEKKSGNSCAQVNSATEEITLTAGTEFNVPFSSALLDVELKQGAQILATAIGTNTAGATETRYYELRSGASIAKPARTGLDPTQVVIWECNNPADSGPDAGALDNCRWPISSPSWQDEDRDGNNDSGFGDGFSFTTLTLKALKGQFSLEGGADGLVAGSPSEDSGLPRLATFFEFNDNLIECGRTIVKNGTNGAPDVEITRHNNLNPEVDGICPPIPFALRVTFKNGVQGLQFLKDLTTQTSANFTLKVTWTESSVEEDMSLGRTTIDYETDGNPLAEKNIPLSWCPDPIYNGDALTGITDALTNALAKDQDDVLDGKQFTCIGVRDARVVSPETGADVIELEEQIYLLGDAYARR